MSSCIWIISHKAMEISWWLPTRWAARNRAQMSNEEMNFTLSDWMLNHIRLPLDSDASTKHPSTPHFGVQPHPWVHKWGKKIYWLHNVVVEREMAMAQVGKISGGCIVLRVAFEPGTG